MKHYHPVEPKGKLSKMTNSQLHMLLTDYRWVYTVFNMIGGRAKGRIKGIQSILYKRAGNAGFGGTTVPDEPDASDLSRPQTGNGVSEHAMLRYLERVKGVDMRALEEEMLEKVRGGTSYFNGAVVVDQDNMSYVMREDGLVKSVMPHEWLSEIDMIAAEESHKIKKRKDKDANFRRLAAEGIDTSEKNLSRRLNDSKSDDTLKV